MATDPLNLPQPRPRATLWITLGVIALTIAATTVYHWQKWKKWEADWMRLGTIQPSGGKFFPNRVELKVPIFSQTDSRWGQDPLANTAASLGAEGCAVSSAAMVLASYGVDTDPGRLNKLLTENDGYEGAGWIRWEKAAELTGNVAEKAYEDDASFYHIDNNLERGNPVIARVRSKQGQTHFVVIAGKEGYEYLIRDPGAGASKGLYPLREYGSPIEKLRFYRRLK